MLVETYIKDKKKKKSNINENLLKQIVRILNPFRFCSRKIEDKICWLAYEENKL